MILTETEVFISTPTGEMLCKIFSPKAESQFPALILYSEIFQLTGPILRSAAMMAGHSFIVVVPEIYHEHLEAGTVLAYDDNGKQIGNDLKLKIKLESYDQGLGAIIKYLQQKPECSGKFGSIGFCLGGHLAFRAALNPDILAVASFYGTDIHSSTLGPAGSCDTFDRIDEMQAEFLMVWGRQDPHIPEAGRLKVYRELSLKNKTFTWHEFNAVHAFMRDEGERYNPKLAAFGYQLAVELFNRALKV